MQKPKLNKKVKPKHLEDDLQIKVGNYLNETYPGALWCHPPNGGFRSFSVAKKLKLMGVKPGVSDILIFEEKTKFSLSYDISGNEDRIEETVYNGLCIELKIHPNKPTKEQKDFQAKLSNRGWQ